AGAKDRDQLLLPGGVTEAEHLDAYAPQGVAILIENAAGDRAERSGLDLQVAQMLSGVERGHTSRALRRARAVGLASITRSVHADPVRTGRNLDGKMARRIAVSTDGLGAFDGPRRHFDVHHVRILYRRARKLVEDHSFERRCAGRTGSLGKKPTPCQGRS